MQPATPKHQKVTEYRKNPDGSIEIVQNSYYEKIAQTIVEIEKPMVTSAYTLEQDIEHALEHIKEGAFKLILTVETRNGEPTKLTKKYMTIKQSYPRK
jgi:hypothetical protein